MKLKSVCVFCGSSFGQREEFKAVAQALGREFATEKVRLVYGGGRVGLMGVVADSVLEAGGEVLGVIPQALHDLEVAHSGLSELQVVDSMHTRKMAMADAAEAFVALPGGFGTFEELFEAITWTQLGIHHKPCLVLNVEGYFDPLLELVKRGVMEGFISPNAAKILLRVEKAEEVLPALRAWEFTPESKAAQAKEDLEKLR